MSRKTELDMESIRSIFQAIRQGNCTVDEAVRSFVNMFKGGSIYIPVPKSSFKRSKVQTIILNGGTPAQAAERVGCTVQWARKVMKQMPET